MVNCWGYLNGRRSSSVTPQPLQTEQSRQVKTVINHTNMDVGDQDWQSFFMVVIYIWFARLDQTFSSDLHSKWCLGGTGAENCGDCLSRHPSINCSPPWCSTVFILAARQDVAIEGLATPVIRLFIDAIYPLSRDYGRRYTRFPLFQLGCCLRRKSLPRRVSKAMLLQDVCLMSENSWEKKSI